MLCCGTSQVAIYCACGVGEWRLALTLRLWAQPNQFPTSRYRRIRLLWFVARCRPGIAPFVGHIWLTARC